MRLRLRLFEFEDLSWFPAVVRAGMMDYLHFMISLLGTYRPIVPLLAEGLRRSGQARARAAAPKTCSPPCVPRDSPRPPALSPTSTPSPPPGPRPPTARMA